MKQYNPNHPQVKPHIELVVDSQQCSDLISGISLLGRSRSGEAALRCRKLLDYLWAQAFHDLEQVRAA